jgi:hypothetical protein
MIYLSLFDIGIKAFLDIYIINAKAIIAYKLLILITHFLIAIYYKNKILNNNISEANNKKIF